MVAVNAPPPVKMPNSFYADPEIRAFIQQQTQILWQLWRRTGGATDAVASTQNRDLYDSTGYIAALRNSTFHTTSTDFTTSGTQLVIVTGAATVTLNQYPEDGEMVRIKRATSAGNVIVSGNGKTIDGDDTYTMLINYEGIQVIYSVLDDAWFLV